MLHKFVQSLNMTVLNYIYGGRKKFQINLCTYFHMIKKMKKKIKENLVNMKKHFIYPPFENSRI